MKKMQIPNEILENEIHNHIGKSYSCHLLSFSQPFIQQQPTIMAVPYNNGTPNQVFESCTQSKSRVNAASSSVINIWPFVTT